MSERLVTIGGASESGSSEAGAGPRQARPDWLRIKLATPAEYHKVR